MCECKSFEHRTRSVHSRLREEHEHDTVLLFCRLSVPKTGPYVMCGRLRYVSHNFNRRPLKFTWELEDREALRGIDAFAEMVALK